MRVRAASNTTPRDWSVIGDVHAHVIEECARIGAHTAIAFALSAVSFVAVLFAPLSAFAAAPRISGTPPATIKVGVWYNFIATISDSDGDALRCSIQNQPAWLVFNKTQLPAVGHPDERKRRHVFEHPDQRQRRQRRHRIVAGILDHGDQLELERQFPAANFRYAADHHPRRRLVRLPRDNFRSERRHAAMLGAEPTGVGRLQPDPVPAVGRADDREHRHLFEHSHQR